MQIPGPIIQAVKDYAVLLGKGYPDKRTLELVADRYQLDRAGRAVLFRGVCKQEKVKKRQVKIFSGEPPVNALLKVDALNQLYSIASYLSGQLVFIAADGILRDASGFHGEILPANILAQATGSMLSYFEERPDLSIELFMDTRADAFSSVREVFLHHTETLRLIESDTVDAELAMSKGCLLATSDSAIIDRTSNPVFDLARFILEKKYAGKIPYIADILSQIV